MSLHRTILTTIAVMFLSIGAFAQSQFEGDNLPLFLGKGAESLDLKDLKANYNCEMANQNHYLSKSGIELRLKNDVLNAINLYKTSAVYGDFKGKLPRGLKFGMTSASVKGLLGKTSVAYNTGYCEFDFPSFTLSCWFENGALNQVVISSK